ncbi:F0F1 ATP synthase subunit A [Spiroplasma helicoides]|uniref:F0F1 ATP synthase subunit A n=1 Tax=Spiroplasma helicoides TaxID=216938 RepID=A0A1B3SJB6_9MOLU|nr:F0F1 ATP synthase subunit A [Spiroplasma helicoides]AOG60017.1 F0F1 ATP synthase subunit A [Spiroplasma helicoides]
MSQLTENWNIITPQLFSIVATLIIICSFCITYNVKIRNIKEGEQLSGFLVLTESFITSIENMVVTTMGKKFRHLTPYAMYIFMYILVSSVISLLGFEPLTSSYTVTLSMAIVSFIGIYYYGLRYQKFLFFIKFLHNPIEIFTQFVPILSLSFRLFGNMIAGSIILGLLYGALINAEGAIFGHRGMANEIWGSDFYAQYKYWWGGFNFISVIMLPWLHLYFDLFDGFIQSIVFTMLTLSYWSNAKDGEHSEKESSNEHDHTRKAKKIKAKEIKLEAKEIKSKGKEMAQAVQ